MQCVVRCEWQTQSIDVSGHVLPTSYVHALFFSTVSIELAALYKLCTIMDALKESSTTYIIYNIF